MTWQMVVHPQSIEPYNIYNGQNKTSEDAPEKPFLKKNNNKIRLFKAITYLISYKKLFLVKKCMVTERTVLI